MLIVTLYKVCTVQAEDVQYRLKETLCSASLSLYCTPSTCSAHPQPLLHTLCLYCTYFIQGDYTSGITLPTHTPTKAEVSFFVVCLRKHFTTFSPVGLGLEFSGKSNTSGNSPLGQKFHCQFLKNLGSFLRDLKVPCISI